MATERNPFEQIPQQGTNVVPMNPVSVAEEQEATFELEPDGGVIVDFRNTVEMAAEDTIKEWYSDSGLSDAVTELYMERTEQNVDKVEAIVKLSTHYDISPEEVTGATGIEMQEKEEKIQEPQQFESQAQNVKAIYDTFNLK